jgi:hypothetical protein
VSFRTQNALVERRYCDFHGRQFAHKNGLPVPVDSLAVVEADLGELNLDELHVLQERVAREIYLREEVERYTFWFDGIGPATSKPYVARLKFKGNGGIDRFFFSFKESLYGPDHKRVHGEYKTFGGAVLEKRTGPQGGGKEPGQPQTVNRFLVANDGTEHHLGSRWDEALEAQILSYLRRQISAQKLLEFSKGRTDCHAAGDGVC